ncbi:hypothetical protein Franean1_1593 [Parafrankia sp. EAN1pec]|uniref:PaaI family thioesterase n=1 Tax=Parafrankia sp. (strain EAN1pec) TaxID=298653 RepID=UPI0000540F7A|nr:hypothetical protein Franean1_1593 [Frankia sp. EAN1pec]
MSSDSDVRPSTHILSDLGFELTRVGDELRGSAAIVPEMFVPGTPSVRTSILAVWADTACGHAVMAAVAPRVPVTLDLDVHVYRPLHESGTINTVARLVKAGKSVCGVEVVFTGAGGDELAFCTASFMAAPNPEMIMPSAQTGLASRPRGGRLQVPLAERARCEIREPGVAVLPRTEDGLNSSNTVSGGLIALAVEEAALSLTPGTSLSSLALRFLRPVRTGPVVATAQVRDGLGRVEARDAGGDNRLAVLATTRVFD